MEKQQRYNRWFVAFYLSFALGALLFHLNVSKDYEAVLSAACMPLFLLIPPVFYRLFCFKPVAILDLCIYVYSFIAFGLGVVARLYRITGLYDKLIHLFAGYAFATLGLIVFYMVQKERKIEPEKDFWPVLVFVFSFSMMIGGLWEIFEYAGDVLFGFNSQRVIETGIHDTMQDMIACFFGALGNVAFTALYLRKNVMGPLFYTFESFFKANFGGIPAGAQEGMPAQAD